MVSFPYHDTTYKKLTVARDLARFLIFKKLFIELISLLSLSQLVDAHPRYVGRSFDALGVYTGLVAYTEIISRRNFLSRSWELVQITTRICYPIDQNEVGVTLK